MIVGQMESLLRMENSIGVVNPKVVVISRRESLLGRAVEYLTADEKEWMILQVSESLDLGCLVQKVEEAHPDIVIISQDEPGHDEQLLARLHHDCPAVKKVIVVSLSENLLEVYSKQKFQVESVKDLFSEVEKQMSIL